MTSFFDTARDFRAWIKANHRSAKPLKVVFHLRPNGHKCLPFDDAQIEAMRFGWCALKRVAIDKVTYAVVFGPRPANLRWSAEDEAIAETLITKNQMQMAGLAAFESRQRAASKSSGPAPQDLSPLMLAELKRHRAAWANYQRLPPSKRHKDAEWVMTAKQERTRSSRFAKLLMDLSRPQQ